MSGVGVAIGFFQKKKVFGIGGDNGGNKQFNPVLDNEHTSLLSIHLSHSLCKSDS